MVVPLKDKEVTAFGDAMEEVLASLPDSERFQKARTKFQDSLWDDFQYSVLDRMGEMVEHHIKEMAARVVTAILEGDENQMKRYLGSDGYTGRDRDHPVIHGTLFEPGPIALRNRIAQAHADLIQNERILDLEDQVRSLVRQINKKDAEIAHLQQRLREVNEWIAAEQHEVTPDWMQMTDRGRRG